MRSRGWFQAPRRLPLLLVPLILIPAAALTWLTLELFEQDRRLEDQQLQESVENAADRIVAASHQKLSEVEAHLSRVRRSDLPRADG